jgi:hypothetical protein
MVPYHKLSVHFTVDSIFRGEMEKEVDVFTGMGNPDCGYRFHVGERYLVYAFLNPDTKRLSTSYCTRTRPWSEASADLGFFRAIEHSPAGGRIYGEVMDDTHNTGGFATPRNLAGAKVLITGESVHIERTSDKEGKYEVAGLRPGPYRVAASLPEYTSSTTAEIQVTVHDRGCANINVPLQLDGRITGRVLDLRANGVGKQHVELVPIGDGVNPEFTADSDEDGRYELKGVRPGDYYLGINLSDPPGESSPYLRTYFPDVHERERAPIIHVDRAEVLTGRDIHLGKACQSRAVTGVVLWPDGRPAKGASIMIDFEDYPWHLNSAPMSNEQGQFSFGALSGLRSYLWIQAQDANGRWIHATKIELPTQGELKPFVAVLNQASPSQ